MKITLEMLRSKNACVDGLAWVEEHLPDGAEYQDFLDALAAADKPDWAGWLIATFGALPNAVKVIRELSPGTKHIYAAGSLRLETHIRVVGRIEAGEGIEAGGGIEAGEGIEAG